MSLTADALLGFIREKTDAEDLDGDSPLFSTGELDSVNQLNLIMFVEAEAKITVAQADVTLENFDSVNKILAYVQSQGGS